MTRACPLLLAVALLGWPASIPDEPAVVPRPERKAQDAPIDYNRDILPILAGACFTCHGPAAQKAGLRLDQREHALKATKSGVIPIQPGDTRGSEVVHRVFSTVDEERMPPAKSKRLLTSTEKELLKRWIRQGAEYKGHWAFRKPSRPTPPKVKSAGWVQNEIDAFIMGSLEKAGLEPAPRADRTTLIRRLSLDLRGLPPSLEEVDAFLTDRSPDAYAKLVERMLASPRYGEKMALLWLDLARFGDTSGFHFDSTRQMWLWRDWVINAFNSNMPYDRFTIEQLAGDLLPVPPGGDGGIAQKIASGFNRNTRFNEEGGVDPEEFVIRYNIDRANTLGQVWLGLTVGCAECHNHKYDPLSQKEYYQLVAYFTGIREPMVSANHNQPLPPLLKVPSAEQTKTLAKLHEDLAVLNRAIAREAARIDYRDPLADTPDAARLPAQAEDVVWVDDEPPPGAKLLGEGILPWLWGSAPDYPVFSGKRSMFRTGSGLHQHYFTGALNPVRVQPEDKLFVYVWLDPKGPPRSVQLQYNDGTWEHRDYWGEDLCYGAGSPDGTSHYCAGPLPALGRWARLEVPAEKIGLAVGSRVDGMAFTQFGGSVYYDKVGVSTRYPPDERVATSQLAWEPRGKVDPKVPADIRAILEVEAPQRTAEQKTTIRNYYLLAVCAETLEVFESFEKELELLHGKIAQAEAAVPHTLITEEMPEPPPTYVLLRGDFLQRGEKVGPGLPAILPPLPPGDPNNRLGLAHWLMRRTIP